MNISSKGHSLNVLFEIGLQDAAWLVMLLLAYQKKKFFFLCSKIYVFVDIFLMRFFSINIIIIFSVFYFRFIQDIVSPPQCFQSFAPTNLESKKNFPLFELLYHQADKFVLCSYIQSRSGSVPAQLFIIWKFIASIFQNVK